MGELVHMRDYSHNYDHLRRHALRGAPKVNVWGEVAVGLLWVAALGLMELDLWLFALLGS